MPHIESDNEVFAPAVTVGPPTITDMVERVARALCVGQDPDKQISGDWDTFERYPIDDRYPKPDMIKYGPRWMAYQRYAIAAIQAMREPTEAMIDRVNDPYAEPGRSMIGVIYSSMIDAALSD